MNMSEVLVRQGHLARGEQLAREALEVSSWLRHPLGVGVALGSTGVARTRRGEFESAREALAEARASLSSIGAKRAVFEVDAQEVERLGRRLRARSCPPAKRTPATRRPWP